MRSDALFALSVVVSLLAASPALAATEEHVTPYKTTVSLEEAQLIADQTGTELDHVGYDGKSATQHLNLELFPSQATQLEDEGFELQEQVTLPKLGAEGRPRDRRRQPEPVLRRLPQLLRAGRHRRRAARRSPATTRTSSSSSRSASRCSASRSSRSRSPPTRATRPTARRPAVLYGATNHAREWITPEVVRREAHWVLDNQDDLARAARSWPRPSCGSCPSRTRTATTTRSPAARARP